MVDSIGMTFRMGDAIFIVNLPAGLDVYAGYVGGIWPTYPSLFTAFPGAKYLSIAINASEKADCLDVEKGDATTDQIPGWLATWSPGNTSLPVIYASASSVEAVIAATGLPRSQYLIWSAHYDATIGRHICGPGACQYPQADGTQWTDHGNVWDESLINDTFFVTHITAPGVTTGMVQAQLNVHGASPLLAVDDVWGSNTQNAVVSFQAANTLPSNGIVDTPTWTKLNALAKELTMIMLRLSTGAVYTSDGAFKHLIDPTIEAGYAAVGVPILPSSSVVAGSAVAQDWDSYINSIPDSTNNVWIRTLFAGGELYGRVVQAIAATPANLSKAPSTLKGPAGPPGPTYDDTAIKARVSEIEVKEAQIAKTLSS